MKTYFIFLCLLISGALASATTQTTGNQDKPSRLYVKSYSMSDNGSVTIDYAWGPIWDITFNGNVNWNDGSAGTGSWTSHDEDENANTWDNDVNWSWPQSFWPNTSGTMVQTYLDSYHPGNDYTNTYTGQSAPIILQNCGINISTNFTYYDHGGHDTETTTEKRTTHITMKLQTGGKAMSELRNLFGLTASAAQRSLGNPIYASAIEDGYYYMYENPSGPSISSQNIAIGSYGNLNTNGNKYISLPDNADVDVTPYVAGADYYTFNETATKYHSYFDLYVEQASPGYGILPYGPNYVGHAFWRFTTDAPSDALQYISPSLTNYLGHSYGFFPDTNNDICNNSVPGQLKADSDNGSYNIHRKFYIGFFPNLINGLQFMRGISAAPPAYCVTGINCVALTVFAGNAAGIWALPADQSPQNFGVTLIEMYPAPGSMIGPFDDETDIFYPFY